MGKRKIRATSDSEVLATSPPFEGVGSGQPPTHPRRVKGTGSVTAHKRSGVWTGKWQARATLSNGASKSLGLFSTYEEAEQACDAYYGLTAQRGKPVGPARRWTLLDAFEYWYAANPSQSGNSRRQYNAFKNGYLLANTAAAVRRGRKPIGQWALGDIDPDRAASWARALAVEYLPDEREQKRRRHFDKYGEEVQFLGLTPSTISIQWALARRAFKWLIDRDYFDGRNPFRDSPKYEAGKFTLLPNHDEPYIFTLQEIVALTLAARPAHRLMLETLFWGGLRSGEVRALDYSDPMVDLGLLRIDQALSAENVNNPTVGPTKTGTKRYPHLPHRLLAALKARGEDARLAGETYLFVKTGKRSLLTENDLGDQMRAACVKAGVTGDPNYSGPIPGRRYQPSPHDTRRTGISMHYALRASTPEILAWAGHGQETTTLRFYARATRDRVLTFVSSLYLDVEEAWNLLYEMTWAVYADPDVPPRYDLLTTEYAEEVTGWPITQMQERGVVRDARRREVAVLSGGDVYAEYLEDDDLSIPEGPGAARPTAAVNDPSRRPANRPSE